MSNRAIRWAAIGLITVGVGLAVALLVVFGNGQHANQLDAIKTAGTVKLGTGGGSVLGLTARPAADWARSRSTRTPSISTTPNSGSRSSS